jgi:hypothetical protein
MAVGPAYAHSPFDLPASTPSLDQTAVLPDAQATWVIYGLLAKPAQVDLIRLDNLDTSLSLSLQMEVFTRPVYATFAPTFAVLAKGLPAPADPLPLTLPAGYGALVVPFQGDPAARTVTAYGTRVWWVGQSVDMPEVDTSSPVYLAVWDATGKTGEYSLAYSIDPDPDKADLEARYTDPLLGDGNEDGKVGVADAVLALRLAVGLEATTPRLLRTLDVWPARQGQLLQGDGQISIADALRLLRRAAGIEPDPFP